MHSIAHDVLTFDTTALTSRLILFPGAAYRWLIAPSAQATALHSLLMYQTIESAGNLAANEAYTQNELLYFISI